MATSFIETMARDFDGRLMELHHEAMECRDVQDIVGLGTDLGTRVCRGFGTRINKPEDNASAQDLFRTVLRILTRVRSLANEYCAKDFIISGLDDLDSVALQLREMLCALVDAADADLAPLPEVSGTNQNTAPDSWFEEDHSGLRGPFA